MDETIANSEQKLFWNEILGPNWVRARHVHDEVSLGLSRHLIELAKPKPGQDILEIGCGTGSFGHLIAAHAPGCRILGVDIAPIMLEVARAEPAPNAEYMLADCQVHAFRPEHFDLAISRFGTMFFDDPVAAFRNILAGLKPGAPLVMVTWGPRPRNPWFDEPIRAAEAQVGPQPPVDPHAPGPMAFADADRVLGILEAAGFAEPKVQTKAMELTHPDREAVIWHASEIGPAKRILLENDASEKDHAAMRTMLVSGFSKYFRGDGIAVPALLHFFSARRPV